MAVLGPVLRRGVLHPLDGLLKGTRAPNGLDVEKLRADLQLVVG